MEENIVVVKGKELRRGYTTGSCATAASGAAAEMLLGGGDVSLCKIYLPAGYEIQMEIVESIRTADSVKCYVVKDGGDDPDVTHGMRIGARVSKIQSGIRIVGGEGVGKITQPGLKLPVGESAINPVPREMIGKKLSEVMEKYSYDGGLCVEICAEGGEEIAKQTFNPRLGIVGGISILGTSGVVEPMSEKALIDTIKLEINKKYADDPKKILICPGNYGRDYCINNLGIDIDTGVKYSNYLGEALDHIVYKGFEEVMIISHIGKFIKVAAGVMNTHSSTADCRMEVFASHAAVCGMDRDNVKRIMDSNLTDEAIRLISRSGLSDKIYASIAEKIKYHIDFRTKGKVRVEFLSFRNDNSVLFESDGAREMIEKLK